MLSVGVLRNKMKKKEGQTQQPLGKHGVESCGEFPAVGNTAGVAGLFLACYKCVV